MDGFTPTRHSSHIFTHVIKFTYCTNCMDCKYAFQINNKKKNLIQLYIFV